MATSIRRLEQKDAWKPFDECLKVPEVKPRLITLLGTIIAGPSQDSRMLATLRRIEDLGPQAASMKPQIETLKEKDKSRKDWYDRIIAGMSGKP